MGKRLDYREELTRRAADCAAQLLDADRTGARFPVLPTLDLLIEAWLEGYRAASRPDWPDGRPVDRTEGSAVNDADFAMLNRVADMDARLRALRSELERVLIDNHLLREENERLRREKPEALR